MTRAGHTPTRGDRGAVTPVSVLLGSTDGHFPDPAVAESVRQAGAGGTVHVVSAARILGSAFGLPHPGLYPNRREREAHRQAVAQAIRRIEQLGGRAEGEVVSTRHGARTLARKARQRGCAQIVVSAGPRPRFSWLSWAGEPYRLTRLAHVPVRTVVDER